MPPPIIAGTPQKTNMPNFLLIFIFIILLLVVSSRLSFILKPSVWCSNNNESSKEKRDKTAQLKIRPSSIRRQRFDSTRSSVKSPIFKSPGYEKIKSAGKSLGPKAKITDLSLL